MATFTLFDEFLKNLANGTIDLDSHTFKAALTNTAPNQGTNTVFADITDLTAGNGYTAAGTALSGVTWAETGAGTGIWQFSFTDPSWTASGGDIATHRYLVIYDDTAASDELVGYVDRGASAVITNGNTRTWDFGASGAFQMDATP